MSISLQADQTAPQGYILVNGTTAATVNAFGNLTTTSLNTNTATITNLSSASLSAGAINITTLQSSGSGLFGSTAGIGIVNTGFFGDQTNLALRIPSNTGAIYIQTIAGNTTYMSFGSAGITFSDSSTLSSAPIGSSVQSWQDVTSSRARNTTYTNSTNRPIMVNVTSPAAASAGFILVVNGVTVGVTSSSNAYYPVSTTSAIVPAGGTYSITTSQTPGFSNWYELR